jgi:hypothetical protein
MLAPGITKWPTDYYCIIWADSILVDKFPTWIIITPTEVMIHVVTAYASESTIFVFSVKMIEAVGGAVYVAYFREQI